MQKLNQFAARVVAAARKKAAQVGTGVALAGMSLAASAQTASAVDQVKTALNDGKTNAVEIATLVVVIGWTITAIFLMRRRS